MIENDLKSSILNSLAEGIFTVDKNFKINFINKSAEKITGFKNSEVIGKFCRNIFQSDLCIGNCPVARAIKLGDNIYDLRTKLKTKEGTIKLVKLNASIIKNDNDEPVGGIISFRDITPSFKEKNIGDYEEHFYGIVGQSRSMVNIFNLIQEIAYTDANVLIQGETGTGKEMIADAIQLTSKRKNEKYVKVNCAVLPPALLASELFGHAKGAFTDAIKDRIGRFELADKGTIFLDEIAEMPLQTQAQLLRVIQNGTFERLGESITRRVDVRIIAATNVNIKEATKQGKFREDLYYRLNVIPIEIPPLRERKEDIPFLIKYFIKKFNLLYNKDIIDIDRHALDVLIKYHWPGNVRELENVIEFAVIKTKDEHMITLCNLPGQVLEYNSDDECLEKVLRNNKIDTIDLLKLLEANKWNKSKVAEILGVNRSTLWRWLKKNQL
ncbi:sigma-54 interaction domain-containing protein [Rosettibacter firmus]|uniref:sigma-54 interaction domain-containing protein n=1 Tax=Rosettibacter firmus TaxID=3111522 RepID=UPI00336BDC3F